MVVLEVCVDSIQSALHASAGGAQRVELCSGLVDGGLTPSAGLIRQVRKVLPESVGVFVLVRPRPGDFLYSEDEVCVMEGDIASAGLAGVQGVVVGCLTREGEVDLKIMERLVAAASVFDLQVTFHRAVDVAKNPVDCVRCLGALSGVTRVLSSGGFKTAWEGRKILKEMVVVGGEVGIKIVAGGGVDEKNVRGIVEESGVEEVHGSLRVSKRSEMVFVKKPMVYMGGEKWNDEESELTLKFASESRVRSVVECLGGI